ncbi:MAG TPA: hypothetical protein VIX73_19375 [Kofleriaceae bacterium]
MTDDIRRRFGTCVKVELDDGVDVYVAVHVKEWVKVKADVKVYAPSCFVEEM